MICYKLIAQRINVGPSVADVPGASAQPMVSAYLAVTTAASPGHRARAANLLQGPVAGDATVKTASVLLTHSAVTPLGTISAPLDARTAAGDRALETQDRARTIQTLVAQVVQNPVALAVGAVAAKRAYARRTRSAVTPCGTTSV